MSTGKSELQSLKQGLVKSAGIIGIATFCSRLLGFIRDVVIARVFGISIYAQAYVIAFRIPNLFRDLIGEGASNAAFVPVFSEYASKHKKEEFWELANIALNILLVILMSLSLAGILFAPVLVRLIAPGFIADPEKLQMTIRLTRMVFPYVLLVGLAAYSMGILNSLKHFALPAFSPCLLNIAIIIFVLIFQKSLTGLVLGVLIGGLLQLAVQLPALYKKGFKLELNSKFRHPAVKAIGKLMIPRILNSGIYQLNNFLDSIFGSLAWIVGEGGVAILYFSYRFIRFPLGIFSNALAQAILPTLSTQALNEVKDDLRRTISWGLRAVLFIMLPASAGFIVLAEPIIGTLFGGDSFDMGSVYVTAQALSFYSIGLFAYGANKILQTGFFALKDTATPTKIAGFSLMLNLILNCILMFPFRIAGLALATSISGIATSLLLFSKLNKRLSGLDKKEIILSFLRIFLASVCMGIVCYLVSRRNMLLEQCFVIKLFKLSWVIILGALSYLVFCLIFRVRELQELWHWLIRRQKS